MRAGESVVKNIVRRIDELFASERDISGKPPTNGEPHTSRWFIALEAYVREEHERLSPKNDLAKAIRKMLVRWPSFTCFLDNGRTCLLNNARSRALRGVFGAETTPVPRFNRSDPVGRAELPAAYLPSTT